MYCTQRSVVQNCTVLYNSGVMYTVIKYKYNTITHNLTINVPAGLVNTINKWQGLALVGLSGTFENYKKRETETDREHPHIQRKKLLRPL